MKKLFNRVALLSMLAIGLTTSFNADAVTIYRNVSCSDIAQDNNQLYAWYCSSSFETSTDISLECGGILQRADNYPYDMLAFCSVFEQKTTWYGYTYWEIRIIGGTLYATAWLVT